MWLDFAAAEATGVSLTQFMKSRLWLVFLPRHLDMAIAFGALGACLGLGFGLFYPLLSALDEGGPFRGR